ncbi:MAG: heme biosynthesis protein HemY [Pseudomonadota bacterium]
MRRLLLILFALVLGAGAIALLIIRDPGKAHLSWGDWQIDTSAAALLAVILALMLTLGLLWRLINLILRAPRLLRQRQARRQQERALRDVADTALCLVEGEWPEAEQICKRHHRDAQGGLVWLLATALAAHRQGASARRDDTLREAETRFPDASKALRLVQAEMLLDEGRLEGALSHLQALHAEAPRQPHVLRLLTDLHRRREEWDNVLQRLPELTRLRALPEERLLALEEEAVAGRLAQLGQISAEMVEGFWRDLRRSLRGRERLVAAYARALASSGANDAAVDLLIKSLRDRVSENLATVLAELDSSQPRATLEAVENLLARSGATGASHVLHLFAARMAWKLDLWGKARAHAEAALETRPSAEGHALLARVLERQGHGAQALEQAMAGLTLARSSS